MRDAFLESLTKLASKNKNIVLLTADLGFGVFEKFEKNIASICGWRCGVITDEGEQENPINRGRVLLQSGGELDDSRQWSDFGLNLDQPRPRDGASILGFLAVSSCNGAGLYSPDR